MPFAMASVLRYDDGRGPRKKRQGPYAPADLRRKPVAGAQKTANPSILQSFHGVVSPRRGVVLTRPSQRVRATLPVSLLGRGRGLMVWIARRRRACRSTGCVPRGGHQFCVRQPNGRWPACRALVGLTRFWAVLPRCPGSRQRDAQAVRPELPGRPRAAQRPVPQGHADAVCDGVCTHEARLPKGGPMLRPTRSIGTLSRTLPQATLIPYVRPDDLRRELNERFRDSHPEIDPSITLSKIRRLKELMIEVGQVRRSRQRRRSRDAVLTPLSWWGIGLADSCAGGRHRGGNDCVRVLVHGAPHHFG